MNILTSVLAGIGIGVFFYAGLWFTVRRLITTRHPVLLTVASFGAYACHARRFLFSRKAGGRMRWARSPGSEWGACWPRDYPAKEVSRDAPNPR